MPPPTPPLPPHHHREIHTMKYQYYIVGYSILYTSLAVL